MKILFMGPKAFPKTAGSLIRQKFTAEFKSETDKNRFVKTMQKYKPDVILFDKEHLSSYIKRALKFTREKFSYTPFIILSANGETKDIVELVHKGADDFVSKKRLKDLPAAIQRALKRQRRVMKKDKAAEELLGLKEKEIESKCQTIVERITDGFIALDNNFCYTYANKMIGELVRRKPESLIGKNVWKEFPEAVGSATYKAFMKAMKEQQPVTNIDYYAPLDLWQENYIYPSPEGLSIFIKDISERKRMERELLEQQKRLTAIALEAQEKERMNIGKELHDNVNQIIVGIKLLLDRVAENPVKGKELLPMCIDNLEKVINENRKIAHELVAPDMNKESLTEQLNSLISPMLNENGIETTIDTTKLNERLLDRDKKLNVYRIAQEQCTNIVKYARAKKALFKLVTLENVFRMIIADDGRGVEEITNKKGIGLRNIEGRVGIFNGSMDIRSAKGKGFRLEISMPLSKTLSLN
jgi:PAS domain S-box-containing protein